ncbi:hypothetical protein Shyhy01_25910 [Streptomyces hygroscopicus subsp. hygroscopicus]|nr:hypothetical protein Shyhy01_25910 [Streptomyces hygroscopicus subsp. hygroscopicus]
MIRRLWLRPGDQEPLATGLRPLFTRRNPVFVLVTRSGSVNGTQDGGHAVAGERRLPGTRGRPLGRAGRLP